MKTYDEFFEGFKPPNYEKMDKQIEKHETKNIKHGPDHTLVVPKYRNDHRNRALKMLGVKDAMLRGEDPRKDTRGGAYAKRGNPDEDHRANYTSNQSFMKGYKPRRTKEPGVKKK